MVYRVFLGCLLSVCGGWGVRAQPFRVDHIGVNDGLTQGSVYYMLKDSRGFMWFGTQDGLNRYDGHRFRTYRPKDNGEGSILGNNIFGIVEDKAGDLWIGTGEGLNRYNRRTDLFDNFYYLKANGKPAPNRTLPFFVDEHELLYISDQQGLVSFNLDTKKPTVLDSTLTPPQEYDLQSSTVRTATGDVWLHAPKGVIRYNLREKKVYHYFSDLPGNKAGKAQAVFSFYIDSANTAWLGTDAGLVRFNYRTLAVETFDRLPDNHKITQVYSIAEDNQGQLWLGTRQNGILSFNLKTKTFREINNFTDGTEQLTSYEVRKVYIDDQGIVWANVDPNGLAKIVSEQFLFNGIIKKSYPKEQADDKQLSGYTIRGFAEETPGGLVWIGTERGINVLDRRTNRIVRRYRPGTGPGYLPEGQPIKCLYRDTQGRIWVGTTRGIMLFNPQTQSFEHYSFTSGSNSLVTVNYVRALVNINTNTLLAGTEDGLYRFDIPSRSWSPMPVLRGHNIFSLMLIPKSNRLLVGTYLNGIYEIGLLNPGTQPDTAWRIMQQELNRFTILHMYNDTARRALWLATDRGLARLNWTKPAGRSQYQIKLFADYDGLANSFVYSILPDARNNLWLSTNRGISRFEPEQKQFKNFDLSDGLQGYEYNGNAYLRTKDGELFFGGVNGFNRFWPQQYRSNTFRPSVHIYDLKVQEEPYKGDTYVGETQTINLPYNQNTLSLEFAAIDFISNGHNTYEYQLEGYDDAWVSAGEKNYVRYANLPFGTYTFKIRAANKDNLWSSDVRKLVINIKPPFWRTAPFIILTILIVCLLVYAWIRRRENAIRQQQAERLKLAYSIQEQVKKDIARDLHDEIGTRLATLKLYISQMAQFVDKNADMRSIKENMFGLINDTISDVRNLLRKLNPRTLEEYGYLAALEELLNRLNSTEGVQAHLTLNNAPDRLPSEVEIMLYRITQELINNTLKHAGATRIDISFSAIDDRLVLDYRDNGVGFDYPHARQGLGIGNIESRVAIIGGRIVWQTNPNADASGQAPQADSGTRVTIDLPAGRQQDQPTHTSIITSSLSG